MVRATGRARTRKVIQRPASASASRGWDGVPADGGAGGDDAGDGADLAGAEQRAGERAVSSARHQAVAAVGVLDDGDGGG
eukprot:2103517-Rhodomonas_salina.1